MAISASNILRQLRTQQELKAQMDKYRLQGDDKKADEIQKKLGTIIFCNKPEDAKLYEAGKKNYEIAYTALYDSNSDGRISAKEYTMKELSGLDSEYKSEYERLCAEKKLNPDEIYNALDKKFGDKTIGTSSFEKLNSTFVEEAKIFSPDGNGFLNKELLGANAQEYDINNDGNVSEKEYIMTKLGREDTDFHNAREALKEQGLKSDEIYEKLKAQFGGKTLEGVTIRQLQHNTMFMAQRLDANGNNDLADEAAGFGALSDKADGEIDGKIDSRLSNSVIENTLEGFSEETQSIAEKNGEITPQQKAEIIAARTTYLYKDREKTSPEMMRLVNYETEVVRSGLRKHYGLEENRPKFGQITSPVVHSSAATQASALTQTSTGIPPQQQQSLAGISAAYAQTAQMGMMGSTFGMPFGAIGTSGGFNSYPSLPWTLALTGLAGGLCGIGLGGLSYPGGGSFNRNLAYNLGFGALTLAPLMMMPSFTKF